MFWRLRLTPPTWNLKKWFRSQKDEFWAKNCADVNFRSFRIYNWIWQELNLFGHGRKSINAIFVRFLSEMPVFPFFQIRFAVFSVKRWTGFQKYDHFLGLVAGWPKQKAGGRMLPPAGFATLWPAGQGRTGLTARRGSGGTFFFFFTFFFTDVFKIS